MTEDALLFAAALANPAEHTPRLVLADWYDERDEPDLAAALRASPEMVAFLSELTKWDAAPTQPLTMFSSDTSENLFPFVPAARLLTRHMHLFPVPPGARKEWSEDAPPRYGSTEPLPPVYFLQWWQHERRTQVSALRELAARASARAQPPEFVEPSDARAFEEQSCLLHELVLRGRGHAALPGAVEHAARMKEHRHQLAWLPTRLLSIDAFLPSLAMRFQDGSHGTGGTIGYGGALEAIRVPDPAPCVISTVELAPESPVFAAVRTWATESNGELEGLVFRLDRELQSEVVGRLWFTRLPADSVKGSLVSVPWFVNRMIAANALALLFGAAQHGGAYSRGEFGAYGRLHAWQSLGALAGCAPEASIDEVLREVERCEWLWFGGSAWFNVIEQLNVGAICVRADRRTVALLAATDTD